MDYEEKKRPGWGAHWLLPQEYRAAWGARAIADKNYRKDVDGSHVASLLADRQAGVGKNEDLSELLKWVNTAILPIYMYYDGASSKVIVRDFGKFHARWTPNGSYGYVYIVAWVE